MDAPRRVRPGLVVERGGELIDTGHIEIRQLCQELRLPLDNLDRAEAAGTDALYHFDGAPYTVAEAEDDFNGVYQKLHRDLSEASYPTTYTTSTLRGRQLDAMSVVDWIEESVPGGMGSRLGQLLDVTYNIEYGAECTDQSALNLSTCSATPGRASCGCWAARTRSTTCRGRNDRLVAALAAQLALARSSSATGSWRSAPGRRRLRPWRHQRRLHADRRRRPGRARAAVHDHAHVGRLVAGRLRADQGARDPGARDGHELQAPRRVPAAGVGGHRLQRRHLFRPGLPEHLGRLARAAGPAGVLVDYTGGRIGDSFRSGTPTQRARQFLDQLEPVIPGATAAWDGRATIDHWPSYEWTLGSYSYYRGGQYQAFGAVESEIEGGVHFCGEHTTQDFQGYLNGAVRPGWPRC